MNDMTKKTIELVRDIKANENCNIEISKDNKLIVRIEKEDKLRYIGSKYSVQRDIESFIKNIGNDINSETIFIIFGLGAGEHVRYLYKYITDTNKILIVEPSAAVIQEVIKLDNCMLFKDDRITLCYLDDKIRKNLNDFIGERNLDNIKVKEFSNYNAIFEKEYEFLLNELKSVKKTKKIANDTLNTFSHLFFNNYIENIFALDEFYTVNHLKNLYKDKTAIIVSAGPSLTKNIHLLKDVQDKFIIISGPRTLGTLIKNGIKPDFLCEVDPQEEVYHFVKDYIDLNIPLVFMDSASSKLVKEQKNLKIIAANQGMENYLEEMLGTKVDSLIQGGSVAHFCMGLAVYMGCSKIIFIGQDLAYTNEKFQAEETYVEELDKLKYHYENNKEEWDKDKNYSIYVKDIYGNRVRTSSILNSYREEFEDLIYGCQGIKFINSTEGGADIKGTEIMDLEDSIKLYGVESLNKNLEELLDDKIVINEDQFSNKMFKIIDKLEVIKKACEDGLKYSDQMLHFYKDNKKCNLNKVFMELDKVDAIINNKEGLGFFAYKLVAAINNVMQNEAFEPKENESERECGIRLAKKSFIMYIAVLQVVEEMIFVIMDTLRRYHSITKVNSQINNWKNIKSKNTIDKMDYDKGENLTCNNKLNSKDITISYGYYDYSVDGLSIYTKGDNVTNIKRNISNIIFNNITIKEDIISLKFLTSKDGYVYLDFYDKSKIDLYKKIRDNEKLLGDYTYEKDSYYQIYIGYDAIGYCINKFGGILRQDIKRISDINEYTVIFNLKYETIIINDVVIKVNKYFIDNYIMNRKLAIIVSSSEEKFKLTIKELNI